MPVFLWEHDVSLLAPVFRNNSLAVQHVLLTSRMEVELVCGLYCCNHFCLSLVRSSRVDDVPSHTTVVYSLIVVHCARARASCTCIYRCHKVCRDAMELVCKQHDQASTEDHVVPNVCESCLGQYLTDNAGLCPIPTRSTRHPCVFAESIGIRRRVMRLRVQCANKRNMGMHGDSDSDSDTDSDEDSVAVIFPDLTGHAVETVNRCPWIGCLKVE